MRTIITTFRHSLLLCLVASSMSIAACNGPDVTPTTIPSSVITPASTPVPIVLQAGGAAIIGNVNSGTGTFPAGVSVYLVPVYWNQQHTEAFYAVDASQAMSSSIYQNGYFQLLNMPPGDYVLVVGQSLEDAGIFADDRNQTRVFTVKPNEVLNVGEQTVKLLTPR